MDSKLIDAIALRIKAGHTKEQIQAEVALVGYDMADFPSSSMILPVINVGNRKKK